MLSFWDGTRVGQQAKDGFQIYGGYVNDIDSHGWIGLQSIRNYKIGPGRWKGLREPKLASAC